MVQRAGDDLGARVLADRHRFASDEQLVDRRASFENRTIDRHFFARPHPQAVANSDCIELYFFVAPIIADAPRALWREVKKRFDRVGGLLARPEFQYLAEQDKNSDDRGGLEIDRDRAAGALECFRKKTRGHCRGGAVNPSNAGSHGDQREHI